MIDERTSLLRQAKILVTRLERLSVDSTYAHHASGLRGAIIRAIDFLDGGEKKESINFDWVGDLVSQGYNILEEAAKQIPDSEK